MQKIMIVEDDENIRELVAYALKSSGFQTIAFENGEEFWKELTKSLPDLILLDIMLPDEDGLSILKKLKQNPRTKQLPIIMLTAKSSEYDKVKGLDCGADDYVAKPFGVMELISRIHAVLRRANHEPKFTVFSHGSVILDTEKHLVTSGEAPVQLTYKEFELLQYLLQNKGIVLSRDKMIERVWGFDFEGESRTVDMHIKTLRQKLGENGVMIETVRGIGYKVGE